MPWGRCDDKWWDHPKVMAMSVTLLLPCGGLYWRAISWSNAKLADGRISGSTVRMLGGTKRHADELVRVGLWEGEWTKGYLVHDYMDFNKSREQVLADRQKWAEQKAGQRMSTADTPVESTAESPRVSSARIPYSRTPVLPSPVLPPPPAKRGKRSKGTAPRQVGDNPRANGASPRQKDASPRQIREGQKRGPTQLHTILSRIAASGDDE